ncbi:MAG: CDF family Co(II)/Ni(II) efflux transporter DmeF [Burkholderiaceae bacterium]
MQLTTHTHDLGPWRHSHGFDPGNREGEARTRSVLVLTLLTMVAEVGAGWWTGSMALLADGWHMGTHALALGVAALAYALARGHSDDSRYAFGTWKIEVLGGFASALVLVLVALAIAAESALRLWRAEPIAAQTALVVAVIGLVVNLVSAWLLHTAVETRPRAGADHHDHAHAHHGHAHDHTPAAKTAPDLNLQGAYLHVLADALTSVFAIVALGGALWLGWTWLDPVVGVLGAVLIAIWAARLLRETSNVLLDREMDHPLAATVRDALEGDGDAKVADLHLWRVGREQFAAIVCIVADEPLAPGAYRERLSAHRELVHVSVEVNRCLQALASAT